MLIEIRPGEGGHDAELFASELANAVLALAHHQDDHVGRQQRVLDARTIVLDIHSHSNIYRKLAGTHRVQRVPHNSTRRHTSTASIAVLEKAAPLRVTVQENDCSVQPYKASGKGGQKRNKTSSAARVTHLPTGTVVTADEERSLHQNIRLALNRIELILQKMQDEDLANDVQVRRNQQISSVERSAKTWTHNQQRNEVLCHETSERWRWSDFYRGKLARRSA